MQAVRGACAWVHDSRGRWRVITGHPSSSSSSSSSVGMEDFHDCQTDATLRSECHANTVIFACIIGESRECRSGADVQLQRVCVSRAGGVSCRSMFQGRFCLHARRYLPFTASFTTATYPLHVKYCTVVCTPDTSTVHFGKDRDRFAAISARSRCLPESSRRGRWADLNYRPLEFDLSTRRACLTTQSRSTYLSQPR